MTKTKQTKNLTLLGRSGVSAPTRLLESFPRPTNITRVVLISDEVAGECPVTGQPDQYTVEIDYTPDKVCAESKSIKLKLQSYRTKGIFCESLADELVDHVMESLKPWRASVTVIQKPRGGVSIRATAARSRGTRMGPNRFRTVEAGL